MAHDEQHTYEFQAINNDKIDQLPKLGSEGWNIAALVDDPPASGFQLLLTRPGLTFQERVTLDQRRRYFESWGIDIDQRDREASR